MALERLHKVLAAAGVASRRHAERLILEGRVAVNGRVIRALGNKVEPDRDRIVVDGRTVRVPDRRRYLVIHKPAGVITSAIDPFGRPTVIDLVRHTIANEDGRNLRVFPIGRLDLDSEGLLLLTDDGELAHRVAHPSVEIDKEYRVLVRGEVTPDRIDLCRQGILLDGRPTSPARVELIGPGGTNTTWVRFVIHEGRKRQVRRMCEAVGLMPVRLVRIRIGPITLGSLRPGQYRDLSDSEIARLRTAVGLTEAEIRPGAKHEIAEHDRDRRPERSR